MALKRYVAFLGGINVGGHRVKMDELTRLFEAAGCKDVTTFLASGNVLFSSGKDRAVLEKALEAHLEKNLGYTVPVFLRTLEEVEAALRYEPFDAEGCTLHICFLHRPLTEEEALCVKAAAPGPIDALHPNAAELYWLCRGRLTESQVKWKPLSKKIGASTARNVTMLRRLVEKRFVDR